jgi:MSHA biogenesis protein MshN
MSLINQMLKDIDKRQGGLSSMPAANHDLHGVMRSKFPLRAVLLGFGLLATLVIAGVVVMNDKRSPAPVAVNSPVAVAPVAPAPVVAPLVVAQPVVVPPPPVVKAPVVAIAPMPVKEEPVAAASKPMNQTMGPRGSVSRVLTAEQHAENFYRDAVQQIQQGRMAEAQGLLRRSLSGYALHHASRQLLARSLLETGQPEDAKTVLLDGLTIAPKHTEFYMALAHVNLANKDLEGAIKAIERGLPAASDNADYHAFYAALLQRNGQHEEAVQQYVTALRQAPDSANWLLGLAISLQAKKEMLSAAEAYQRAINLGLSPSLMQFSQDRLRQMGR